MDIYHQRNDVASFETLAEELYAAVGGRGGKIWEKVEEMGRKLNPENPMFRGGASSKATPTAPAVKSDTTAVVAKTAVFTGAADEMFSSSGAASPPPPASAPSSDFDLDMGTSTSGADSASDSGEFDLDLGAATDDAGQERDNIADFQKAAQGDSAMAGIDFGTTADNSVNFDFAKDTASASAAPPAGSSNMAGDAQSPQWDEAATKLDLAKAYIDMGDSEGARGILQEVMTEGSDSQKKQAQELASQIS